MFRYFLCAALAALAVFAGPAVAATTYSDTAALAGVREGKGVFMINVDQAQKLALYLKVIGGTHDNLARQGAKPDLKVVFIGATVKHLMRVSAQDADAAAISAREEIGRQLAALDAKGVGLEVCAIATELFGVDNAQLFPVLNVINDGFVSAIGYQTQGFQLVPIY